MSKSKKITTQILIPAYSAQNNALLITLQLEATPNKKLIIQTQNSIAIALKRSLRRAIEIMASIHPAWETLLQFKYQLSSEASTYLVKDARSAGLPLAIGMINIFRSINHQLTINSLIGTGILRIDGSIEATHKEDIKHKVIHTTNAQQLITSSICQHVFELATFMDRQEL
ncbi:MAG: hypothetical protein K0U24_04415 [Gammaproteobacteria bacterium]|nr:hypothetical protein [Gammaproteobacteria bacterium]MCH9763459.1 hypothetical protein [Gammaproteobacteria bacterium]